jgi:Tol biopolymer transport system component
MKLRYQKHIPAIFHGFLLPLTLILGTLLLPTGAMATEEYGTVSSSPAISPNGQEIVFASNVAGTTNLWIMTSSGTSLRKLTSGLGIDNEPAWSSDGTTIAFSRLQNNVKDIWAVQADGSNLRQLTSKTLNNFQPVWSPSANQIAFVSDRAGTNDIWIMNADGTNQTRVTQLSGEESEPSFSPSGTDIVFSETTNGSSSLFVVTVATGATRSLTGAGFNDWHPSWSSAGIIFASDRLPKTSSGNKTIWVIQSNGSGLHQFASVTGLDPSWTPDGNVLFTDEANPGVASAGISLLNSTSGVPTPLLSNSFNGDLNGDGIIDLKDIAIIQKALNTAASQQYDSRDRNGDGKIDALDMRVLATQCSYDQCVSTPPQ